MHDRTATQTQFSLRSILVLTTIVAIVPAVLGATGIRPLAAAVGFGAVVASIAVTIAAIELIAQCGGWR